MIVELQPFDVKEIIATLEPSGIVTADDVVGSQGVSLKVVSISGLAAVVVDEE